MYLEATSKALCFIGNVLGNNRTSGDDIKEEVIWPIKQGDSRIDT